MTFNEVLAANLAANLVTLWLLFAFWRLRKAETMKNIAHAIAACCIMGLIGWAAIP